MMHCVTWTCRKCGSLFKYKIVCPFCNGTVTKIISERRLSDAVEATAIEMAGDNFREGERYD
jgi:hypothetical protein